MKSTPKEATMYRRKRKILKSLVLGLVVAALAAPAALAEPRGPGNPPITDPLILDAIRVGQSADDRSFYRGSSPQMVSPDDRSLFRGASVQVDAGIVSPDDRSLLRSVETPNVPLTVTVSSSSANDFQWSDAALGGVSTLAFVLLLGAGTFMIRHQRRRLAF